MKFLKLAVSSVICVMMCVAAHAQSTVGTIYGSVVDASGAKLPTAQVTVTDVKNKVEQTGVTDGHGDFNFVAVNPSDYTVTVARNGFVTQVQTGITVDANQNVNVSFKMVAGGADLTIEVTAGTSMVDTREAQIGETIDEAQIENLPTLNRDPYELLETVTGVSGYTGDTVIGTRNGTNFTVNGFPSTTSSFYLDGAQNNALEGGGGNKAPNPSALQEARILTSNFDAQFGRSPGAVVNLITKSGTDHYHGQVYDYIRNDAFDAKNYFADPSLDMPFKQHQAGAAFGGRIPFLQQTFFFTSYEHLQLHQNEFVLNANVTYPTIAEASGDFTADAKAIGTSNIIYTGCNGVHYVICPNAMDQVAVNVMKLIPKIDPLTGTGISQSANADNGVDQGLGRIDYNGLARHSMELTYFNSRGYNTDPGAGGNQLYTYSGMRNNENQMNAILADNWIISNNVVNSARVFYTQNHYVISNTIVGHSLTDLGSTAPPGGPISAPPRFNLGSGILAIGPQTAGPSDISQLSFGLVDVATLEFGLHSVKLGGSYIWNKYAEDGGAQAGGTFAGSTNTGNPYADFLLGMSASLTQSTSVRQRKHNYDPALYVQDNWHIASRLTLNLGVRWEVYPPFQGDRNSGTFRAGVQSQVFPTAPLGILYEGDRGVAPGIANTSYTRFAPRIGFAYDAYGDGRTSLRGGYGIFYYQQVENDEGLRVQQPFGLTETISSPTSFVNPYAAVLGVSPFPYTPDPSNPKFITNGTTYGTTADGGSTPYAQEFNFSLQQQLTKTYALQIAYVGSNFIKQLNSIDINTPVYGTGNVLSRRPYEPYGTNGSFQFGPIQQLQNNQNTHFSSLQVTLRGKLGKQINLNSSYVWSKALNYLNPVDQTNLRSSYGPANVDLRNRFVLSALFAFPSTKRLGWLGKEIINGWNLNAINYIQSGTPFTVTSGVDTNADGNDNDRPNLIGDPYTHAKSRAAKIRQYINPAAFATPTGAQLYGTEQRNSLVLPPTTATSVSLFKAFAMMHRTLLQFRAESFNVFGNVNLQSPRTNLPTISNTSNINTATFYQLQAAGPPRRMQFAIKYLF